MGICCATHNTEHEHNNDREEERIFTDDIEFMINNVNSKERKYISTHPIRLNGIIYDSNGI